LQSSPFPQKGTINVSNQEQSSVHNQNILQSQELQSQSQSQSQHSQQQQAQQQQSQHSQQQQQSQHSQQQRSQHSQHSQQQRFTASKLRGSATRLRPKLFRQLNMNTFVATPTVPYNISKGFFQFYYRSFIATT
jgi:hypothetical protein